MTALFPFHSWQQTRRYLLQNEALVQLKLTILPILTTSKGPKYVVNFESSPNSMAVLSFARICIPISFVQYTLRRRGRRDDG